LTLTPSSGFLEVPGLTQTITTTSDELVYLSTDGGMATTSGVSTGSSTAVAAIAVDGSLLANSGEQQLMMVNNASLVGAEAYWSMSAVLPLGAGTHTIAVFAEGRGTGSNIDVSGDTTNLLQAELTVLVLKR
jgi:hypothetical protein